MATVYLALGSNIGDSQAYIQQAISLLATVLENVKRAPLYTSKAVDYTDQPDFLNTVISGETSLSPQELLLRVKGIERQVGRIAGFHWGPREIDIDIIMYGDTILTSEKLTIPHPRFSERDFVLQPLNDLNPTLIDPLSKQTVQTLLARLDTTHKSLLAKVDEKL